MRRNVVTSAAASSSGYVFSEDISKDDELLHALEKVRSLCQNLSSHEAINLLCGHVANSPSLEGRTLCHTCNIEQAKHSPAYCIRDILTTESASSENSKTTLEKIKEIVQDPVTLELLTEALNMPCGHILNISTLVRLESPHCPVCRKDIQNAAYVSSAHIIRAVAMEIQRILPYEDVMIPDDFFHSLQPATIIAYPAQWMDVLTDHINQIMPRIDTCPLDHTSRQKLKKHIRRTKKYLLKLIRRKRNFSVNIQLLCGAFLSHLKAISNALHRHNQELLLHALSDLNCLYSSLKITDKYSYNPTTLWQRVKHFICPWSE